jgi:hypothetical protein
MAARMLAALSMKSGPHVSGRLHESTKPVSKCVSKLGQEPRLRPDV